MFKSKLLLSSVSKTFRQIGNSLVKSPKTENVNKDGDQPSSSSSPKSSVHSSRVSLNSLKSSTASSSTSSSSSVKMNQVEPSEINHSDIESNNNITDSISRKSSALSRKSGSVTIVSSNGSGGLDYGVVNVVPTPPPMPSQPLTHFPSNPILPSDKYRTDSALADMTENRRKPILINGSASHTLSSGINIVTSPTAMMEKPILPGVYK